MKLRGYLVVGNSCDEKNNNCYWFSTSRPDSFIDSKVYTFTIDVPHNLTELKTVENIEEVKE